MSTGAGIELSLTLTGSEGLRRSLAVLAARAEDLPMEEIGATLVLSTRQRFFDEVGPDGARWEPLKPRTQTRRVSKLRRRGPKHILRQRRTLFNSITFLAAPDEVAVGTGDFRAPIHQLGGTAEMAPGPAGIPARPFLGLSTADEDDVSELILRHLAEELP